MANINIQLKVPKKTLSKAEAEFVLFAMASILAVLLVVGIIFNRTMKNWNKG